jgi:hypothetical protein
MSWLGTPTKSHLSTLSQSPDQPLTPSDRPVRSHLLESVLSIHGAAFLQRDRHHESAYEKLYLQLKQINELYAKWEAEFNLADLETPVTAESEGWKKKIFAAITYWKHD